jgi:signal transduction histidine kinase/DNA-binding response OmpR family regulator/ligand-binding sensor domain-containing protein
MKIRLHIYLVIPILTTFSPALMAQNNFSNPFAKEWKIEKVDLPGLGFEEIVQDSFGFLWIGTGNGLIRYDGVRAKTFVHEPDNPNSLSSDDISDLYLENEQYLWIGCYARGGLNRMDLYSGLVSHYLDSVSIWEIVVDTRGNIWAGSYPPGLYRIDPKTGYTKYFPTPMRGSTFASIHTIIQDRDGIIWIGGPAHVGSLGIWQYVPELDTLQLHEFQHEPHDLSDGLVTALLEDSHGKFWVGTSQGRLYQVDRKTSKLSPVELLQSSHGAQISTIFEDKGHQIWILTWDGIFRIDPLTGQQSYFGRNVPGHQTPSDVSWTIFQSQDSVFWIGTGRRGGILFKLYQTTPQLTNFALNGLSTYSFLENTSSDNPEVWIGTDDGLVLFDLSKGQKKHYTQEHFLPGVTERVIIHSLCQGTDSSLWAACLSKNDARHNGLLNFDTQEEIFRYYPIPYDSLQIKSEHRPPYNSILDLEADRSGGVFIATLGYGLKLFDSAKNQILSYKQKLDDPFGIQANIIVDLYHNQLGELFVAGRDEKPPYIYGKGMVKFLARMSPGTRVFTEIDLPASLKYSNVFFREEIFQNESGNTWIQTRSDLLQLDSQLNFVKIVTSTNSDLLPVAIQQAIIDDDQFWIKGENLIYRFDPVTENITSNIIRFQNPKKDFHELNYFHELNLGNALRLQDGTILFAADSGFLRLNPHLPMESYPARISFASFDILQHNASHLNLPVNLLNVDKKIILSHDENNFTINFFIPDYRDQENNSYKFRLDNYDEFWHETSTPEAIYRSVPPGEYEFKVQATGYRHTAAFDNSIQIIILPPWYWAWWSKSLYLASFLFLTYGIYRYQLKRQLAIAEASRLKELDTFKSRLYTNITHEFRTPLTVILGMAEQLQDKIITSGKEGLQMINRHGNHLLHLVNQILDLQKLEADALPVNMIQGDIVSYLKYLVESFQSYAESKNIQLQCSSHPEAVMMDYDPQKIQDIFSNLVSNALKFTLSGGSINIDCSQEKGNQLKIRVRDNGIGISEEKLPHIFDRFYQADDSSIRRAEGTGIGLALTRELVKLLGGEISVKSIPGAGSEFTVLLPIHQSAPVVTSPLPDTEPKIASLDPVIPRPLQESANLMDLPQILIIEDNPDVVQYIVSVLNDDYHITTASDGKKGLEQALQYIPDLIISDVMMPQMDGFQVLNTLKQDTRTSHIPIILLTAKADIDSKLEGLQYGADAYLTKPFHKAELLVRIQSLLTKKQRLQAHYLQLYGVVKDAHSEAEVEKISIPENEFIAKIRSIINDHLDDSTFGVDQLGHLMAMSNSQLYRKLMSQTGHSAQALIQSIRLSKAKELLTKTENNVSEIAYDCGFNDPEYFSRVFKKETGFSPTDYRNN